MMKTSFLFLAAIVLSCAFNQSASAMCGGGGYKPSPSKPSVSQTRVVESQPVDVSYRSDYHSNSAFSTRFDSMQNNFQLSSSQQQQIADAKANTQRRLDSLQLEQTRAQHKLDNCRGKCEKERRQLDAANDRLSRFDADREFDRQLRGILREDQWRKYSASSRDLYNDAR